MIEMYTMLLLVIPVGNAVLLKPSEVASHTSNIMMELIPQYLDPVRFTVLSLCTYVTGFTKTFPNDIFCITNSKY